MVQTVRVLFLLLLHGAAIAAENKAEQTLVYPCRPASGSVIVDGTLGDAEWAGAIEVSAFRISGSKQLAPEQVIMRLLYDRNNLYVGVRCLESQMKKIKAAVNEKDGPFWADDSVEFFLDPQHDHETYWQFAVTAGGALYDNYKGDSLWNSGLKAAVRRESEAWTVEAAFPFADLGIPSPTSGALWGFNLCRERQAGGTLELYNWADVKRVFKNADLFGHIRFVGPDWQPTPASIAAAAQGAGGSESIVYAPDGYWRVQTSQTPEHITYRSLLRQHDPNAASFMEELRAVYQKNPKMTLFAEFKELQMRFEEIKSLAAADTPLAIEDWVKATAFLDSLREKAETICWKVRLAQLNESF